MKLTPGGNIKIFFLFNFSLSKVADVTDETIQPSLIFLIKARYYPSGAPYGARCY
jgi:hypothetical protein